MPLWQPKVASQPVQVTRGCHKSMFNIQQGEDLTIQFDIDAHEYNGRWFNEIRAYNVTRGQAAQSVNPTPAAAPFPPAGAATAPFPPAQEPAAENAADDLPF